MVPVKQAVRARFSGTLAFTFVTLSREIRDRRVFVWTVPLMVASVDLAMVGVFSENAGLIHGVVSEVFFIMIIVAMLAYSYVSWPLGSPRTGAAALAFGILSSLIWFIRWLWTGVAVREAVTSGMTAIWLLLIASASK